MEGSMTPGFSEELLLVYCAMKLPLHFLRVNHLHFFVKRLKVHFLTEVFHLQFYLCDLLHLHFAIKKLLLQF